MKERKFSVNSKNYTDKHNNIMDNLLFSYSCYMGKIRVCCDDNYAPNDEEGLKLLEYLRDLDLIEEVAEIEH